MTSSCKQDIWLRCNYHHPLQVHYRVIAAMSNDRHGVSNYRSIECLFNSVFELTTKKHQRSALLSLCEGNPLMTSGFHAQRDRNAENVFIWWRHSFLMSIFTRMQHIRRSHFQYKIFKQLFCCRVLIWGALYLLFIKPYGDYIYGILRWRNWIRLPCPILLIENLICKSISAVEPTL